MLLNWLAILCQWKTSLPKQNNPTQKQSQTTPLDSRPLPSFHLLRSLPFPSTSLCSRCLFSFLQLLSCLAVSWTNARQWGSLTSEQPSKLHGQMSSALQRERKKNGKYEELGPEEQSSIKEFPQFSFLSRSLVVKICPTNAPWPIVVTTGIKPSSTSPVHLCPICTGGPMSSAYK